ncbi:hypothetical protein BH23GEM6_BH23GEM6_01110 [soil metagenome]
MESRTDHELFPSRREPKNVWERTGLTATQERRLNAALLALIFIITGGWIFSAAHAVRFGESPDIARRIAASANPLSARGSADMSYLMDAMLRQMVDYTDWRGESGEVRVVLQYPGDEVPLPADIPEEMEIVYQRVEGGVDTVAVPGAGGARPQEPGIWNMVLRARGVMRGAVREIPHLNVITTVPAGELREGRIGAYRIGSWPSGQTGAYAAPAGFVQVTPENMNTHVSRHFQLKDFLTKGQEGVWPKYVVISPRLLDKLELTIQELERAGHPVENVFVISGFRTPWYNVAGGNPSGRGALSRHMYGDAADIAIDNTRNGCMDDLNGDGRADVEDARIIVAAAERVERRFPHLVGGIGIYRPVRGSHCGMVHIDTRGHRARW